MTDKNPRLASNRLIAAAFEAAAPGKPGECVIGTCNGNVIVKLAFEVGSEIDNGRKAIRVVLTGPEDYVVDICEAEKFEDLHDYLVNNCQISTELAQKLFNEFLETQNTQILPYKERLLQAEEFNQAAKDLSPGLLNEFDANGLNYSIVHQPSYRTVFTDHRKDQTIDSFYTVYIKNSAIEDPDQSLVNTDSFDTLFEAIGFIRTDIEQRLFKAFMPEVFK